MSPPPSGSRPRQRRPSVSPSTISQKHLTPLWTSLAKLVTPEPASGCEPAAWSFSEVRAAMIEAGGLITAKEAERRADSRESRPARPVEDHDRPVCRCPARAAGRGRAAHRHSPERAAVRPRRRRRAHRGRRRTDVDALRRFHHHAADGLARPRQQRTDQRCSGSTASTSRSSSSSTPRSPSTTTRTSSRSRDRLVTRRHATARPADRPATRPAPRRCSTHARTRSAGARRGNAWDPCHGLKMRYSNPVTGGYPMTTIAAFIQLLPKGFQTARSSRLTRRFSLPSKDEDGPNRRGLRRRVAAARYLRRAEAGGR